MKINLNRKPELSLVLIVLFTFALLTLIALTLWRNNATTKLEQTLSDLGKQNREISLADRSINKFFHIENDFRLYTATGKESYRAKYSTGLSDLQNMLDSLQSLIKTSDSDKFSLRGLLNKREAETDMFLRLKSTNDSLVLATAKLKNFKPVNSPVFKPLTSEEAQFFVEKTTELQEQKSPRKLFGRIKDAITNNKPNQISTVTTVKKIENNASVESDVMLDALNSMLRASIDKLTFNYEQLSKNERRIILSNDRLLTKLSTILNELKGLQIDIQNLRETELNKDAKVSIGELSDISRLILAVGVILSLVILYNAWQSYKHEKGLVAARNEAIRQIHVRSDFLSHMSHEIRTPLNSILGFSEQIEGSVLDNVQREQITAIRQSSKILLSIVNDVLDLSKFETGNLNLHTTNFYPEKTIKHIVSSMEVLAAKKNINLSCNCEMDHELRISGDEYRLKQVLINLINNAIKFTDTGTVEVKARLVGHDLLVDVVDSGRGIAKEHLTGIFDEFTQITKAHDNEKHNGSGLGLAICKKIVGAQGGRVEVKSQLGKGSVFSFRIPYLPFQTALETDLNQVKLALDTAVLASKKVLVAEDDKMNIKLISTIFKKWGLEFDMVENGIDAFEHFKQGAYDMLLTDIHMPEGDGISLTKKIRSYPDKFKSRVPILAITANAMEKDLHEYREIGINDHVVKPFSEENLFEKIRSNMREETLV